MYRDAVENFQKFLELSGDDANTYYNIAYIYEHGIKERKEAIKYYRKYLELEPESDDLYEVRLRISSLEREGTKEAPAVMKAFKIDLDKLKY